MGEAKRLANPEFCLFTELDDDEIDAEFCETDLEGKITATACQIANLSKPEHVVTHAELIDNYGLAVSPSSSVYEGDGFVIRMFFNNHNPPHFHVFEPNMTDVIARYIIESLDLMSGQPSGPLARRIRAWAVGHCDELMQCWQRCRKGEHPLTIDD